jgi:N-acetylglucosaminyldiphosphoundecaprenol N-acetyl-beta-D-mannosaminyltransferase
MIKNSTSKMLFSTLWMKKQEQSVVEIMEKCPNIKLWLWVWSSFDYYIGFQKRAPYLFRALWLEWFYRLLTWPRKIDRLKRLYNAIVVFLIEIIKFKG